MNVPVLVAGTAVLVLLTALALVFLVQDGGDAQVGEGGSATQTPADPIAPPPPTMPDPSATTPVTDPPVTDPPVLPEVSRPLLDGSFADGTGPVSYSDGSFVAIEVDLVEGQPVRFRVEPSEALDTQLLLLVDTATAREVFVRGSFADAEADEIEQLLDQLQRNSLLVLNAGAVTEAFAGMIVMDLVDRGDQGEPDADVYVAAATGRFTIAAQAWDGAGEARLIVETSDLQLDPAAPWWWDTGDPWFDDPTFFEDEDPYRP